MLKKTAIFVWLFTAALKLCAQSDQRAMDSMIHWLVINPKVDSQYILTLHKISYRYSENDVKKSFYYYQRAALASDSIHFDYGKSLAQINLGILLSNSASFEASNNAFFKAIEYAEKCNATRLKSVCLNNIAENFVTLNEYEKARKYTLEAIDMNLVIGKNAETPPPLKKSALRGAAINYELLEQIDIAEGKYADAWKNLQSGVPYADISNDPYIYSQYYTGFGKLHAIAGREDSATYYFTRALQQAQAGSNLRNAHLIYLAKARFLKTISVAEKLDNLDSALVIARNTEYLKGVSDAAGQLSAVYDELNNKDSSLYFFRVYKSASDSLFSENNKRNVVIKETEWMIKRKELENVHLKNITDLQSKELRFKNGLLLAVVIGFLLAIAVAVLIYKSIESKKRQADAIQKQKEAELKNQLTELEFKAFKAQLNPHFIFNYLNSISGYILLSQPEKASDMIKKFSRMLRNVLQNSEQNTVPLADDIKTIEQYLELMHEISVPTFTWAVHVEDSISNEQKMVPPLFIQPFVENAILHGIKQSEGDNLYLHIFYRKTGNALQVEILDNGTGFDSFRMQKSRLTDPGRIHLGLSVTEKRIHVFSEKNNYQSTTIFSTPFPETAQPGTRVLVTIERFFGEH